MEDKIREYEAFIKDKTSGPIGPIERVKLAEYHKEMIQNFQHERLIHLIVTLFFSGIALVLLGFLAYDIAYYGFALELLPFYALTVIVVILSGFYIKHYYFLENHVQGLYKYNKILRLKNEKKED